MRSVPLLTLLVACEPPPAPTGETTTDELVSEHTVDADGAPARYTLHVRTPPGYDPDGAYPVLVQLDADFTYADGLAAGIVSALEDEGVIGPTIVVGLGHQPSGLNGQRTIDFVSPDAPVPWGPPGASDRFLTFVREQLVPWIDAGWATSGERTLSGHSLGGAFAFEAFTADPDPTDPLFRWHVAGDFGPGPDLFVDEAALADRTSARPGGLYLTRARWNGAGQQVPWEALVARVEGRAYDGLVVGSASLPTDHGGTIVPTVEGALRFFAGEAE